MDMDNRYEIQHIQSVNGIDKITPFPVPIQRRLEETIRELILISDSPRLLVPYLIQVISNNNYKKRLIFDCQLRYCQDRYRAF
jgi:hypothetical protein